MPKVTGTRRQKALELYEMARKGPSLFPSLGSDDRGRIGRDEFERGYRLWSETWILPRLEELVPELKSLKEARERRRLEALGVRPH